MLFIPLGACTLYVLDYEFVCFTKTVRIPCRPTIKQEQNLGNKKLPVPILTETLSQFHTLFGLCAFFWPLSFWTTRFFCSSFKEQPHEMNIFKAREVNCWSLYSMYAGSSRWWLTILLRMNFKVSCGVVFPDPHWLGSPGSGSERANTTRKILNLKVKCWIRIEIPV